MATAQLRATVDDLMRTEGKAELIGGRIVEYSLNGYLPSAIASNIAVGLRIFAKAVGRGKVLSATAGFVVPELISGRESFVADAAFYDGPPLANPMKFIPGPPTFAVEVRSESDYGPAADAEYADKRHDYFEAGTKVVWDVDPVNETVTRFSSPTDAGTIFRRGEVADAEPAVPGWRISLNDVFQR